MIPGISPLALGTVELGMDYGFRGSGHYGRPAAEEAIRLLRRAVDLGITLFDTAPSYGDAEALIGRALAGMRDRPLIATKVGTLEPAAMAASIEASLRALGVERIDVLQIHYATPATFANDDALRALDDARRAGKVRWLGASFYDEDAAYAGAGRFDAIQVPFSLLDQKMARRVLPAARAAETAVLVRSAFLRGILTPRVHATPEPLARLREAALAALAATGEPVERLAEVALRFCLGVPGVTSVIVGVRSIPELEANAAAAAKGALALPEAGRFSFGDDPIVNPSTWQGLI
ncbi:MAG: aldo/keto reductase [Bryobacteraceae bacterium]